MDGRTFFRRYVEPHSRVHSETPCFEFRDKWYVLLHGLQYLQYRPISCIVLFETSQTSEQANTHRTNRFKKVVVKLVLIHEFDSRPPQAVASLAFLLLSFLNFLLVP